MFYCCGHVTDALGLGSVLQLLWTNVTGALGLGSVCCCGLM